MSNEIAVPANDARWSAERCRTNPIPGSMRRVPGYPETLCVYLTGASSFWQARCFFRGRMRTRSLRTTDPRRALRAARAFYEELITRFSSGSDEGAADRATPTGVVFRDVAEALIASEHARVQRGAFSEGSFRMLEAQLRRQIIPAFGELTVGEIGFPRIEAYVQTLSAKTLSPMTIHHYLIALRKVLKHAVACALLDAVPAMPPVHITQEPRGSFSLVEYRRLVRSASRLARLDRQPPDERFPQRGLFAQTKAVHPQLPLLARFMVNSFIRPHDIKLLRHKHVQAVRGASTYLRLTLPETKKKTAPVVTMSAAVGTYERLRARAAALGLAKDDDFVFLPEVTKRHAAMWLLCRDFGKVLEDGGLRLNHLGRPRTLYSLRHTAIMFRLLYGKGIDLLTLARTARTSVAMIERFYASTLTAEMNIGLLHSRRPRAA